MGGTHRRPLKSPPRPFPRVLPKATPSPQTRPRPRNKSRCFAPVSTPAGGEGCPFKGSLREGLGGVFCACAAPPLPGPPAVFLAAAFSSVSDWLAGAELHADWWRRREFETFKRSAGAGRNGRQRERGWDPGSERAVPGAGRAESSPANRRVGVRGSGPEPPWPRRTPTPPPCPAPPPAKGLRRGLRPPAALWGRGEAGPGAGGGWAALPCPALPVVAGAARNALSPQAAAGAGGADGERGRGAAGGGAGRAGPALMALPRRCPATKASPPSPSPITSSAGSAPSTARRAR